MKCASCHHQAHKLHLVKGERICDDCITRGCVRCGTSLDYLGYCANPQCVHSANIERGE